jgi:hypothetical protein
VGDSYASLRICGIIVAMIKIIYSEHNGSKEKGDGKVKKI